MKSRNWHTSCTKHVVRVDGYDVDDWLEAEWELIEKRKVYRLVAAA
jgi:hypothetical protein